MQPSNSNTDTVISSSHPFSDEVPELLNKHLEQLTGSGISIDVTRERGYESVLGKKRLADLGFSKAQQRYPGILIPLHSVDGSPIGCQFRPDYPRLNSKSKPIKYENPTGSSVRLDVPPRCKPMLQDPNIPIFFTEGVKKGDALASQGACAVALNGIFGFRGKNLLGGITIQSGFDYIALNGREAFVIYDSDIAINAQVRKAQDRLLEHLRRKGTNPHAIYLPPRSDGEKQGVDDFLAAGHTLGDVIALAVGPDEEAPETRRSEYVIQTEEGKLKLDLAKLVDDLLGEYHFATFIDTEEILIYDDGVWKTKGEVFIKRECQRRVDDKELLTKYKIGEITGHIQRSTYKSRQEFSTQGQVLNLVNGLYFMKEQMLVPHRKEFLSTIQIPLIYNPDADCPLIKKFLGEILVPEDVPIIEEIFGYCLVPAYWIHRAFLMIGDGSNGKSTVLELLKAFLGLENCAHVSLQDIKNKRFAPAGLYGKLANTYADIPSQPLKYTGLFKMLTGGDTIGAEKKFKPYFSFVNHAKLVFSTNKPPQVEGEDSFAFWRRWVLVNFPNKFIGDKCDKLILAKITSQEELSGLLNLALQGLNRLFRNGDFSYTPDPDQVAEIYRKQSDPIYAFIDEMCESNPAGWESKEDLYKAFVAYCDNEHISKLGKESFGRQLKNVPNVHVIACQHTIDDERVWGWKGVKIKK